MKVLLPVLYQSALGLCRNRHDAEDLVHDACVKALRAFEQAPTKDEASCRGWLMKILLNTFRDQYRREGRSPISVSGDEFDNIVEFATSPELEPDHQITYDTLDDALHGALHSLAPEVRMVIVLHTQSGLSYKAIAELLECPIGTVMSRLTRGREKLRHRLRHLLTESEEAPDEQSQA